MKLVLIPLAAAAMLAGGAVSPAQGPPDKSDVTLSASSNPTLFRAPMSLSGRVKGEKAGISVVLQRRSSPTAAYSDVATVATTGNGEFAFALRPRRNGYFRALARTTPEATSDELFLQVAPKVTMSARDTTIAPGARARFRGKVRPRHNGRRIQIQRRNDAGVFETVAKARLRKVSGKKYSRFRKRVTVPATGVYRALLPGHLDHAEGVSPEVTITTG